MAQGYPCRRTRLRYALWKLLVASAAIVLATGALAQPTAPIPAELEAARTCSQVALSLARAEPGTEPPWESSLSRCQRDADFLAALGQRVNRLGRHQEAADHLERALMLDPARQDVQMAYAFALIGLGDATSARVFLQDLLGDQALPPALRAQLERQVGALAELLPVGAAPEASWRPRLSLSARYGHDSNLLGTPNLSSLSLTIAGQSLPLPLDESYLARPGNYARTDLQLELGRDFAPDRHLELAVGLRHRRSWDEARSGSGQVDLLLEESTPSGGFYWGSQFTDMEAGSGVHYQTLGLGAGLGDQKMGGCVSRFGLEAQERSYINPQVLSGRYTGYTIFTSCALEGSGRVLLSLRHGADRPSDPSRPGGTQTSTSVRVLTYAYLHAWGEDALLVDLEHTLQEDDTGYSPILGGGAVRGQRRQALRLEYQKALTRSTLWLVGVERQLQDSNLELFRSDNSGAYTSLRWAW